MTTITLLKVNLRIRFDGTGRISSNIANTLRGGFGAALRDIACTRAGMECRDCNLSGECAYGYVFETPVPPSAAVMRKYPYAPHPLVLSPPREITGYVSKGETSTVGVTLIGNAVKYFPYVLLSFKELGRRGLGSSGIGFSIERAECEDGGILYEGDTDVVTETAGMDGEKFFDIIPGNPVNARFSIHFMSPLRLKVGGRITSRPTFRDIVAALSRRAALLSYFHCGGPGEPLHDLLLGRVGGVKMVDSRTMELTQRRFSSRQKRKIPMDGFMGTLTFEGDYGTFAPLLRVGEYIHVGKDTVFGYGQYRVEVGK